MCLDGSNLPEKIEDSEILARVIFSPSMLAGEDIAPSAFNMARLPGGDETYVSVHRLSFKELTFDSVKRIRPRVAGDSISGYAKLKAGDARNVRSATISIELKPRPSKSNLYHAGIYYTQEAELIKGACMTPEFLQVTTMLAKLCTYIPF